MKMRAARAPRLVVKRGMEIGGVIGDAFSPTRASSPIRLKRDYCPFDKIDDQIRSKSGSMSRGELYL